MTDTNQLNSAILAADTLTVLSELKDLANDGPFITAIDPLGLYCEKTGQLVARRSLEEITHAIQFVGVQETIASLYNCHGLNIAPQWYGTSPDNLDTLQSTDTRGYVTYCLTFFTAPYYKEKFGRKLGYKNASAERYWATARAYALLETLTQEDLDELASRCCHLLSYDKHTRPYMLRLLGKIAYSTDSLANMAAEKTLIPAIQKSIDAALLGLSNLIPRIKRDAFDMLAHTPEDMASHGISQIKGQSRIKRKLQSDSIAFFDRELMNIVPDLSAHATDHRLNRAQIDLSDLATLDLDAMADNFDEDEDEDDMIVEVRKLSPKELELVERKKETIIQARQEPVKPKGFMRFIK